MTALLPRAFFERDVVEVSRDLIGREIARDDVVLRITECEAYCGPNDSAAHSRVRSTRTEVMFGEAGRAYVYLCYGIHWMLNLVTGGNGEGTAVLIRSCDVISGLDTVVDRRKLKKVGADLVAGPGKVAQALALDSLWNRHDVCAPGGLELREGSVDESVKLLKGPRVGVDYAKPKDRRALLRFAMKGSAAITVPKTLR